VILYHPLVYWVIVLNGVEFSILFLNKEEGGSIGAFGWSDGSLLDMFLDEFV